MLRSAGPPSSLVSKSTRKTAGEGGTAAARQRRLSKGPRRGQSDPESSACSRASSSTSGILPDSEFDASCPESERLEQLKDAYRAIQSQWNGFWSYEGRLFKAPRETQVANSHRLRWYNELIQLKASCFWLALCLTVELPFLSRMRVHCANWVQSSSWQAPVSVLEAMKFREAVLSASLDFPVAFHDVEGGKSEILVGRLREHGGCPAFVLLDDAERFMPHWLPIRALKTARYVPSKKLYLPKLPVAAKPVEVRSEPLKKDENMYSVLSKQAKVNPAKADAPKRDAPVKADEPREVRHRPEKKVKIALDAAPLVVNEQQAEIHLPREHPDKQLVLDLFFGSQVAAASWAPPPKKTKAPALRNQPAQELDEDDAAPLVVNEQESESEPEGDADADAAPLVVNEQEAQAPPSGAEGKADADAAPLAVNEQVAQAPPPARARDQELPFFHRAFGSEIPPPIRGKKREPYWHGGQTSEACPWVVSGELECCISLTHKERHMLEARPDLLKARQVRPGDWVYTRVRGQRVDGGPVDASRALNLAEFQMITCEHFELKLGEIKALRHGGATWQVAPLVRLHLPFRGLLHDFLHLRSQVRSLAVKHYERVQPVLQSLQALPTPMARVRTVYSVIKPVLNAVNPALVGIVNDARNDHLGLDEEEMEDIEPVQVAQQIVEFDRSIRSQLLSVQAFGLQTRQCKTCVSCGCSPPKKYRWKHRTCDQCRVALQTKGYVTPAGCQVQMNLHVPTCYPGMVQVKAEVYPPPPSKWADVNVRQENPIQSSVTVCWRSLDPKERGKPPRWDQFEKRDMARLRRLAEEEDNWAITLAGIACSGARPTVSAKTAYNCAKTLLGRVYRTLPERPWGQGPQPGRWEWAKQFVEYLLPDFRAPRLAFPDWLATMPKRRQTALLHAWEDYERRGWTQKNRKFTSFIKRELLPGFAKKHGDLVPLTEMLDRPIHGPDDLTHCIGGPILKPLTGLLKKRWSVDGPIFYGSSGPEGLHEFLQKLLSYSRQYFWCDFSMYDRTHSAESWAFVEALYPKDDPLFSKVLDAWRKPKGRFGPFKYEGPIMNASGRDDTALANAVLNGFATYLSAAAAFLDVELDDLTVELLAKCRNTLLLSVCGDDSLGAIPMCSEQKMADFRRKFNGNIVKFGFIAKLCTSPNPEEAVYLGCRPYPTDKGWFWGKTIGRATYKLGWVMHEQGRDPMAHMTGIADMHVLCSSHVPVLSDIAKKVVQLRAKQRRTPVVLDPDRPWEWTYQSGVGYSRLTLESVARAYSRAPTAGNPGDFQREVTIEDVEDLIKEINNVQSLPCVIDHWLWKHMIYLDDL